MGEIKQLTRKRARMPTPLKSNGTHPFQNQTDYRSVIWFLQGGTFVGGGTLSQVPPAGWKIAGPR
jgi:hypothetical protein